MASKKCVVAMLIKLTAEYPLMASDSPEIISARANNHIDMSDGIDDRFWVAAVSQVLAEAKDKYLPNVGIIRNKALALIAKTEPDTEIDAAKAWRQLANYLISDGVHGGPSWRNGHEAAVHPLAKLAAQRFGERRFVGRMSDDEGTDFAQFRGIFEALKKRDDDTKHMLPAVRNMLAEIGGAMTAENRQLPPPPPRAIGIAPVNYYERKPDAPPANPELAARVAAFKAKLKTTS